MSKSPYGANDQNGCFVVSRNVFASYSSPAVSKAEVSSALAALRLAFSKGRISEPEYERQAALLEARQAEFHAPFGKPRGGWQGVSYFPAKPARRDYDREKARLRARSHARSRWLPDHLAASYTDGELAVLAVYAAHAGAGRLDWPKAKIAALAGVSESTVANANRRALSLGHISIQERRVYRAPNLPNVVKITSPEWLAWIAKRPASWRPFGRRGGGCKSLSPTSGNLKKPPLTPPGRALPDRPERRQEGVFEGRVRSVSVPYREPEPSLPSPEPMAKLEAALARLGVAISSKGEGDV